MRTPWNKGKTSADHISIQRIAVLRRETNNFLEWQQKNRVRYTDLTPSGALAELYGTMLGDGCIEQFPRTEKLTISFNKKERAHIKHIQKLLWKIFKKRAGQRNVGGSTQLYLYQKYISKRLKFPVGIKKFHDLRIPGWIRNNKKFLIRCLRGLFETDGSWKIDPKYNTNVINYKSIHESLLNDIQQELVRLGFYARRTTKRVTLNRRAETEKFAKLIKFRQY